jgi:hypothetical protein
MTDKRIKQIIMEELTKADVNSIVSNKISSEMDSREFKKAVKKIAAEVLKDFTRILWQRQSFWASSVAQ